MNYYIKAINTNTGDSMIMEFPVFTNRNDAEQWGKQFKDSFMYDIAEIEIISERDRTERSKNMKEYYIRDKHTGEIISEKIDTRQDAETKIKYIEHLDQFNDIYVPDSYEIEERETPKARRKKANIRTVTEYKFIDETWFDVMYESGKLFLYNSETIPKTVREWMSKASVREIRDNIVYHGNALRYESR